MKQHPLSESITPPQSHEEYEALKESIREHGLMQPIIIFEDSILDGWHRFKACEELKIKPWFEPPKRNGGSPLAIIKANSLARRNLSVSQKACMGAMLQQEMAKETARLLKSKQVGSLSYNGIHSSHKVSKMFGVPNSRIIAAVTVLKRNPTLFKKCLTGGVGINSAYESVRDPSKRKVAIVDVESKKVLQEHNAPPDLPDCFDSYEKIMEYSRQFCEKNGLSLQCHFVDGGWVAQYYKNGLNKKAQWQEKDRDPNLRRAIIIALREALKM